MDDIFHLKIPFDKRCQIAGLYGVTVSPQLVAVSVHNKTVREKDKARIVEFIRSLKHQNQNVVLPVVKTAAELEEENRMAEKARVASERANAFLKNRNNAQAQATINQAT